MASSGDMRSLNLVWAVFLAQYPLNVGSSSGDLFVQTSSISLLPLASGLWEKLLGGGGVQLALQFEGVSTTTFYREVYERCSTLSLDTGGPPSTGSRLLTSPTRDLCPFKSPQDGRTPLPYLCSHVKTFNYNANILFGYFMVILNDNVFY